MSRHTSQHTRRVAPGGLTTLTVGGTSTAEQDLSAYVGQVLVFQATVGAISLRFGATGIADAVTSDYTLAQGERAFFEITASTVAMKAISTTAAQQLSYGPISA